MTINNIKHIMEREKLRQMEFIHTDIKKDGSEAHFFWSFRPNGNIEEYSFRNGDITFHKVILAEAIA